MNCELCNKEFEPKKKDIRIKFCSTVCSQKVARAKRRQKVVDAKGDRRCFCGESLNHRALNVKHCNKACYVASIRKVDARQDDTMCQNPGCEVSLKGRPLRTKYCCDKCRITGNNTRRYVPQIKTERECELCKTKFSALRARFCSHKCRGLWNTVGKDAREVECSECDTRFMTGGSVPRVTCSTVCSANRRARQRKISPELKAKRKAIRVASISNYVPKPRVKVKVEPKIEVPMFMSEPEPRDTPKDTLAKAIGRRNRERGNTRAEDVARMQQAFLDKGNKIEVIPIVEYKATEYQGELMSTHEYSKEGSFTGQAGQTIESSTKNYGI